MNEIQSVVIIMSIVFIIAWFTKPIWDNKKYNRRQNEK